MPFRKSITEPSPDCVIYVRYRKMAMVFSKFINCQSKCTSYSAVTLAIYNFLRDSCHFESSFVYNHRVIVNRKTKEVAL